MAERPHQEGPYERAWPRLCSQKRLPPSSLCGKEHAPWGSWPSPPGQRTAGTDSLGEPVSLRRPPHRPTPAARGPTSRSHLECDLSRAGSGPFWLQSVC